MLIAQGVRIITLSPIGTTVLQAWFYRRVADQ